MNKETKHNGKMNKGKKPKKKESNDWMFRIGVGLFLLMVVVFSVIDLGQPRGVSEDIKLVEKTLTAAGYTCEHQVNCFPDWSECLWEYEGNHDWQPNGKCLEWIYHLDLGVSFMMVEISLID